MQRRRTPLKNPPISFNPYLSQLFCFRIRVPLFTFRNLSCLFLKTFANVFPDPTDNPKSSEDVLRGARTWKFDCISQSFLLAELLIFRGKKIKNFAGFSGANSRKNRPISRDFCGKKVKIRGKIARFHEILAEKIQISKDS